MAHFTEPTIHAVEAITAKFDAQNGCVTLRMIGRSKYITDQPLDLTLYFSPGAEGYAEKLAQAINSVARREERADVLAEAVES